MQLVKAETGTVCSTCAAPAINCDLDAECEDAFSCDEHRPTDKASTLTYNPLTHQLLERTPAGGWGFDGIILELSGGGHYYVDSVDKVHGNGTLEVTDQDGDRFLIGRASVEQLTLFIELASWEERGGLDDRAWVPLAPLPAAA